MVHVSLRQERLVLAAYDLRFLLDRGYPRESSINFVGNHYQLRQIERDVLYRGVFSGKAIHRRKRHTLSPAGITGSNLGIDGHNVLITLESALKGRHIILANDGFVRDVSRVFRSYRPTGLSRDAWQLVLQVLKKFPPDLAVIYLDAPLSKSRELSYRIKRWTQDAGLSCTVEAVNSPEHLLLDHSGPIVSADSLLLDRADRIFDLAGYIILKRMESFRLSMTDLTDF